MSKNEATFNENQHNTTIKVTGNLVLIETEILSSRRWIILTKSEIKKLKKAFEELEL